MPAREYFRRRGEPAFRMVGVDGEAFDDVEAYVRHLAATLPEQYLAGRDFQGFVELLRKLAAGRDDAQGGERRDAQPAARRRRLPVQQVGALGGRRAGQRARARRDERRRVARGRRGLG